MKRKTPIHVGGDRTLYGLCHGAATSGKQDSGRAEDHNRFPPDNVSLRLLKHESPAQEAPLLLQSDPTSCQRAPCSSAIIIII